MEAIVVSKNQFVKVKDVAMEISMSTDYVRKVLIREGHLEGYQEGSRWLVSRESLDRYLARRRKTAAAA